MTGLSEQLGWMKDRHVPVTLSIGAGNEQSYCKGCAGPNGTLTIPYPCDAAVLLEIVEMWTKEQG